VEVTPAQLIALLREGTAPAPVRSAIAKGTLPLPPATLIEALDLLGDDPDAAVAASAVQSLERLPPAVVRGVASSPASPPALLERIARRFPGREEVALDLARNPALPDAALAFIATLPFAAVLEVVGRNAVRLERAPELVAALLANAATPLTVVQLWQEHEERRRSAADAALAPAAIEEEEVPREFHEVLVEEAEEEAAKAPAEEGAEALNARQLSIYQILKKMTMGQKVALAVKGNREVRNILIRDNNRMLCLKVLENPRIADGDIEAYAKSTNVSEDVLRGIANTKEWIKKYPILKGLVFNPKTPIGVTLDLLKRITFKDLEGLAKNRNVPETLRSSARRLYTIKRDRNER
jgi:hypothetical protein